MVKVAEAIQTGLREQRRRDLVVLRQTHASGLCQLSWESLHRALVADLVREIYIDPRLSRRGRLDDISET